MTFLLVSFRSTDFGVMRISAYNFPVEIALKCFSVGFVLKCVHMSFFFQRNSRMSEAWSWSQGMLSFLQGQYNNYYNYNNNNDDDYNNNNNYYYYYDKNYYYNYFYI